MLATFKKCQQQKHGQSPDIRKIAEALDRPAANHTARRCIEEAKLGGSSHSHGPPVHGTAPEQVGDEHSEQVQDRKHRPQSCDDFCLMTRIQAESNLRKGQVRGG
jgi:hypothetical protein